MAEQQREVKTYQVVMICDNCGAGQMRPTDMVLTSYPAQYRHVCNNCGHSESYLRTYPYTKYVGIKS